MKKICLENNRIFDVSTFDEVTGKKKPYYQGGGRYALCTQCGSSVNIKGGKNNKTQSRKSPGMYASHTSDRVEGLHFNPEYQNCIHYTGNENNWQQVYTVEGTDENHRLKSYIENYRDLIVQDLTSLTGIRFWKWMQLPDGAGMSKIPSALFEKLYSSFIEQNGLLCASFTPDAVPLLLLAKAGPIDPWGCMIENEDIVQIIQSDQRLSNCLVEGKFKPAGLSVRLVAVMNDNASPTSLKLRLERGDKRLRLRSIPMDFR